MAHINSSLRQIFLGCVVAAAMPLAQADVTVEESMAVNGAGLMKMANMTGRTVTTISGRRARTDTDLHFESALVRTFARGVGQTTQIVLLDEDKIFDLYRNHLCGSARPDAGIDAEDAGIAGLAAAVSFRRG